ncbi:DUF5103 domain-containing protein [Flavobacterium ammoniigenes]|jgi:hypothetical protein|uniref:DUF5103 domain-containing protein n=1 Tax=Flavobacterium ammoniigenes TaxID=1751095 RepID=A0ABN6KZ14_9FLAO|nr:DUF5103 domain-containing protein [Flavobacterium ammoniigenes]BDB53873.1 DUF5103 domain-containing protein [Flavobacterium ammoniigenes]
MALFYFTLATAQVENEIVPPYNIKTVSFVQNKQNVVPIFQLGDAFELQFDDLYGTDASYFYEIVHCDYDWKPSEIQKQDYLQGFDNQRVQESSSSFNCLQIYTHYRLSFPNSTTQLKISGNYMLKILNEDKEVIFSRKFIVFEDLATVPIQIKRARTVTNLDSKHNLEFTIKSNVINFQNPLKNIKTVLLQNGKFNNAISNIKPQFTIGNDLVYKYDTPTQFWAGNEFLYFDNKEIRVASNTISRVDSQKDIYSSYLFTNEARANSNYYNNQDVNGNFVIRRLFAENNDVEADYAWVYFSLSAPLFRSSDGAIYVTGMFNNYALTTENKMEYNPEKAIYEKAILIKQGFTNFEYLAVKPNGSIDSENAIDGNFFQTENEYTVLVYYKEDTDRYTRIIGKGTASSLNIIN